MDEPAFTATYLSLFNQIWQDPEKLEDVTAQICDHIASVYQEKTLDEHWEWRRRVGLPVKRPQELTSKTNRRCGDQSNRLSIGRQLGKAMFRCQIPYPACNT
jgi:hypothetical protein